MDDEQQQQQSEQSRVESALLKLHEEFHQLLQECLDCRREVEPHWQFCAHCGVRLATHCPGCSNPLPVVRIGKYLRFQMSDLAVYIDSLATNARRGKDL